MWDDHSDCVFIQWLGDFSQVLSYNFRYGSMFIILFDYTTFNSLSCTDHEFLKNNL